MYENYQATHDKRQQLSFTQHISKQCTKCTVTFSLKSGSRDFEQSEIQFKVHMGSKTCARARP